MYDYNFRSEDLIKEVKSRPGLWDPCQAVDRIDKLNLWKQIGEAVFKDWDTLNKATAYDRVLQLQKKWRSLKDAYNRELRNRKRGFTANRREYIYYRRLLFLGGHEGLPDLEYKKNPFDEPDEDRAEAAENEHDNDTAHGDHSNTDDPLVAPPKPPKRKTKRKRRNNYQEYDQKPEQIEIPMFINEIQEQENDSDKLFLLSFYPEMKKLPPNIKMWTRAQIANIMQEAVNCHFNNTLPPGPSGFETSRLDIKRPRHSSSD